MLYNNGARMEKKSGKYGFFSNLRYHFKNLRKWEPDSMDNQLPDQGYPAFRYCGGIGAALGIESLFAGASGVDTGDVGLHDAQQYEGGICGREPRHLPDALFQTLY